MSAHVCESITRVDPEHLGVGAVITECGVCGIPMVPDGDGVVEAATTVNATRSALVEDITHAPTAHIGLSDRHALAEHLLLQGWRR